MRPSTWTSNTTRPSISRTVISPSQSSSKVETFRTAMVPSQIESLEWLEIGLSERAVRIEHHSPIDDLHIAAAVDSETRRPPQVFCERPHGLLLVGDNQQADRVTFHESIERQWHRDLLKAPIALSLTIRNRQR